VRPHDALKLPLVQYRNRKAITGGGAPYRRRQPNNNGCQLNEASSDAQDLEAAQGQHHL